jgi:hypothetical protein
VDRRRTLRPFRKVAQHSPTPHDCCAAIRPCATPPLPASARAASSTAWTYEWSVVTRSRGLRTPRTLDALAAARDGGLVSKTDAVFLARSWGDGVAGAHRTHARAGRPSDQCPPGLGAGRSGTVTSRNSLAEARHHCRRSASVAWSKRSDNQRVHTAALWAWANARTSPLRLSKRPGTPRRRWGSRTATRGCRRTCRR